MHPHPHLVQKKKRKRKKKTHPSIDHPYNTSRQHPEKGLVGTWRTQVLRAIPGHCRLVGTHLAMLHACKVARPGGARGRRDAHGGLRCLGRHTMLVCCPSRWRSARLVKSSHRRWLCEPSGGGKGMLSRMEITATSGFMLSRDHRSTEDLESDGLALARSGVHGCLGKQAALGPGRVARHGQRSTVITTRHQQPGTPVTDRCWRRRGTGGAGQSGPRSAAGRR
ncbi:hypothetical protein VTN02DRAFT_2972 [Thermoascus thermophilus]